MSFVGGERLFGERFDLRFLFRIPGRSLAFRGSVARQLRLGQGRGKPDEQSYQKSREGHLVCLGVMVDGTRENYPEVWAPWQATAFQILCVAARALHSQVAWGG